MYIVGQTGEVIVNSERIECIYEQMEKNVPAIRAKTSNVTVTLGLYKTKQSIDRAMADLALALMAGDSSRMHVYMMRKDEELQEIKQTTREVAADGKQEGTEPAGGPGVDGTNRG